MATLKMRLLALETVAVKVDVVGLEVCTYEEWPDPLPNDWRETFPGSGYWLSPVAPSPDTAH
jgi:hypothetical protein